MMIKAIFHEFILACHCAIFVSILLAENSAGDCWKTSATSAQPAQPVTRSREHSAGVHAQSLTLVMALKAHIDALNSYCGADALFSRFRLDEDTVTMRVDAGAATGTVSICLHERSSYPRTGALAYAEGSGALEAAVQEIADAIGESASLDKVVRMVGKKLPDGPSGLGDLLAGLPAPVAKAAPAPAGAGDDESDDAMDEGSEAEQDDDDDDT